MQITPADAMELFLSPRGLALCLWRIGEKRFSIRIYRIEGDKERLLAEIHPCIGGRYASIGALRKFLMDIYGYMMMESKDKESFLSRSLAHGELPPYRDRLNPGLIYSITDGLMIKDAVCIKRLACTNHVH